jgi:hypothetical protein
LTVNLVALGLGPTSIAAFTDYALHDERRVGLSLAIVPPIILLVSSGFARAGRAPFQRAIQLRGQQGVTYLTYTWPPGAPCTINERAPAWPHALRRWPRPRLFWLRHATRAFRQRPKRSP